MIINSCKWKETTLKRANFVFYLNNRASEEGVASDESTGCQEIVTEFLIIHSCARCGSRAWSPFT